MYSARWIWCLWYITYSNRPDRVAQLVEQWASVPKVVGSIPTVARHIFQPCPVLIYTQSNITSIKTKVILISCYMCWRLLLFLSCNFPEHSIIFNINIISQSNNDNNNSHQGPPHQICLRASSSSVIPLLFVWNYLNLFVLSLLCTRCTHSLHPHCTQKIMNTKGKGCTCTHCTRGSGIPEGIC